MEKLIAYHCAPALAGIKPSNIVTCYKNKIKNINEKIEKLNNELNKKGIYVEILCECEKKALVMVYRKKLLEKTLQEDGVKSFLVSMGYPEKGSVAEYLEILKKNLKKEEFSHEIGAFLGYPLHDIYGFMYHRGEGCLLCGEWKVYKNADEAEKLFHRFGTCRRALCRKVQSGKTLEQVFC
ncbi:MAG: DUF3793 family protein [Clostridia bacterium]|nr:DUF3793 family protein [Clostridia bacterium]